MFYVFDRYGTVRRSRCINEPLRIGVDTHINNCRKSGSTKQATIAVGLASEESDEVWKGRDIL